MCQKEKPLVVFGPEDDVPEVVGMVLIELIREGRRGDAYAFLGDIAALYRYSKESFHAVPQIRDVLAPNYVQVQLEPTVTTVAWGVTPH